MAFTEKDVVTLRLVAICCLVAATAFAVGGWVGDYNAKMSKIDSALASLANTMNGHETRIRAVELDRPGK